MSKKEFCANYASQANQNAIKGAACITYLSAVISLIMGFTQQNYMVLLDVILIIGLGLGIQLTKNRVFAVILLVYSCLNTLIYLVSLGRIAGWWLILAGISAVRATFQLHKEYQRFLEDGTVPPPEPAADSSVAAQPRTSIPTALATFAPFVALFPALLLSLFSLSPMLLNGLLGSAQSPEALLLGYRNWYISLIVCTILGLSIILVGVWLSLWKGMRTWMSLLLIGVSLALFILVDGSMMVMENIPGLLSQAQADLAQIKDGDLREATVWFSPKSREASLPGPYTSGQPKPLTRYGGIGADTNNSWVYFYVPDNLGFSLDQSALFHETESVEWNEANARQYRIRYTDHLNLVVSVEPIV